MHSIRTKFTLLTVGIAILTLGIATAIGVYSIWNLGRDDADEMLHLTCTTGALNLEAYFDSVEDSVATISALVDGSFEGLPPDQLGEQVERSRTLFGTIAENTNGVLTYYFRIDPEISDTVNGYWCVNEDGKGFQEHEVTDIRQYDTNDTSQIVWFTVPKATGEGVWLPPYYTESLGERVISYNEPVYWGNQFVGVIGIEIDYETLAREAEAIKVFKTGYAFILDEDGNVIYHPQLDSATLDMEVTDLKVSDSNSGDNHVQYSYNGVEKEAVWLPLSNGMRLYVTAPVSEINSGWQSMVLNILLAALIILAICIFATMSFASHFTKPLRELMEAAQRVDHGDYDFKLDYNEDDEVGALTRTFKELAAHTQEHIKSLNEQVYVDSLTSVRNKGGYASYIEKLQDQLDNAEEPIEFAFVAFDCNNLKEVNDTYGHEKGDACLQAASWTICHVFQHSPVFRIGGDEFAVILQNDDYQNKDELVDAFEKKSAEINGTAENQWDRVDVALGLAVYDPEIDASVIDVARRADRLMYENKRLRKMLDA